jgi:hypothetical protein
VSTSVSLAIASPPAGQLTREAFLRLRLFRNWWTIRELATQGRCSPSFAWRLVKQIGRHQIIFRQRRRLAFKQPYEYRSFLQATAVRGL